MLKHKVNLNKFCGNLRGIGKFLQSLVVRHKTVDDYFRSLEKDAESEEARNERLTKRVELKKREFELNQRIQDARAHGRKLEESYLEFDPKAKGRRTWKVYALLTIGMISFFLLLRACTGC